MTSRTILKAFAAAACALLAASCVFYDSNLYRDTSMAQVVSPNRIVLDSGLEYTIVDQKCDGTLETGTRVIVVCDIVKKRSATKFDVKLISFAVPLNKEAVRASTLTESLGEDPIFINNLWVSGGYLNMRFTVREFEEGKTHYINLEWDDAAPIDTLRFTLRHDDGIDGIVIPSEVDDSAVYGAAYATFPIEAIVPAGMKEIPIKLKWNWDKEYCIKDGLSISVAR